jgi:hypothetical protein
LTAANVRWSPEKSLWIGGMTLAALVFAPLTFSWPALALFLGAVGGPVLRRRAPKLDPASPLSA